MTPWEQINAQIIQCGLCPRLVVYRNTISSIKRRAFQNQDYWGKPVPGFGDINGRVMVVGLAPGAHGSNRTGRMFTGDASGEFLYQALYKTGFANQPVSTHRDDGLKLSDIYISAICRCVPPDNKPETQEIKNCIPYLSTEMSLLTAMQGIVVLGRIAFEGILKLYAEKGCPFPPLDFHHGAFFPGDSLHPWLLASYHPSRQNTQTGRLTESMFVSIWQKVAITLNKGVET